MLKALQNKSCLSQRKKNLYNPHVRTWAVKVLVWPGHLNVALKRNLRHLTGCRLAWLRPPSVVFLFDRHLWYNSPQAWKRQAEGFHDQAAQSCYRSVQISSNFPHTWTSHFLAVWLIFCGEIKVCLVGILNVHVTVILVRYKINFLNSQCHFNVKMVGPLVANLESVLQITYHFYFFYVRI